MSMYLYPSFSSFLSATLFLSLFLHLSLSQVEVYSVKVACKVASRFAHTVITSSALNKANSSQEVFFEVDLPKTAFITNFSMSIEGQTYTGEVKEKEKAKKQYQKAVSTGQTAGLVKASGRKMEKFSVSVNIAANSNVTFILTYEELLQRKLGQYEIMTQVKPKQLVQHFEIVADIYEPQGIAFLEAYGTFISNELLPLVEKTVTDKKAHISFCPTMDQQRKCPGCDGTLIDGDFFIKYDVNRAETLGDIQIVNGYFVHFFAPPDLPRVPKNVVFVIDRSGSMSGNKIHQTREAMLTILNDLHEDDYFGIVTFDHHISTWKDSLTKATTGNVSEAKGFVKGIYQSGYTDINGALMKAVDIMMKDKQAKKFTERSVSMIILLTDGMPNSGVSSTPQIQENVRDAMGGNMSLFCLGFGNDVDYSFLDVMSRQNQGLARRIYEGSDATVQLQGFYEEVASPLLSEVDLHYPDNLVNSLTTSHYKQLFNGSEIVVAGRLTDNSLDNFLVEVFAKGVRNRQTGTTQHATLILSSERQIFISLCTSLCTHYDVQYNTHWCLTVTLRDSVRFVVILHKVWKQHPYHQDYLGFYTLDSHLLSPSVHGLLGQFYHGVQFEVRDMRPGEEPEKPDATMLVKGQELTVTRGWQRDFSWDVKNGENVPCWFIHSNGNGLIDGNHTDYIMSGLFKTV
uniref:Inter-alpha-trypsin inhibitor heavy chain H3 n=1 Tax=Oncorhynchus mykiss TaxID=8022 RepID=A0A8C7WF32_ONCMY